MTTQQMLAPFRRAINDYKMIEDNDYIAVGVSGGKDSLTLLTLLKAYQRFSPNPFKLVAITIDLGFEAADFSHIQKYCDKLEVPYLVEKTDIGKIIFEKNPDNPCSLCSKMRRGALNTKLNELGCNKLALGHHSDDVIETFFLSMCYEGRLSTFAPISYMSRTNVSLIRPMVYLTEKDITAYSKDMPIYHNPCPADKHTQRQYMKDMLKALQKDIPFVKERVASAVMSPDRYNLWDDALRLFEEQKNPKE